MVTKRAFSIALMWVSLALGCDRGAEPNARPAQTPSPNPSAPIAANPPLGEGSPVVANPKPQESTASQETGRQAKLEQEFNADEEAQIAEEYYTERNRRFLNALKFQKELYDKDKSAVATIRMKFVVEHGPQRLTFNEIPYTLEMKPKRAGYTKGMTVIQIIDDLKVLVSIGSSTAVAVGWNTTNLVDGETIRPKDAIVVSGTTEYTAVTSARKRVYVVQPFGLVKFSPQYAPEVPESILEAVGKDVKVGDGQPKF